MNTEADDPRTLPRPLHTIDLEASSLGPERYPIEVEMRRWISPRAALGQRPEDRQRDPDRDQRDAYYVTAILTERRSLRRLSRKIVRPVCRIKFRPGHFQVGVPNQFHKTSR